MSKSEVPAKKSRSKVPLFAVAGTAVLVFVAVIGLWLLSTKPVEITQIPSKPNATEIWITYKQVGKLPGGPNEQFTVVAHGSDNFPFYRVISAKDVVAGGKIALAVPKGERFRVSIRVSEKGAAISNTLYITL